MSVMTKTVFVPDSSGKGPGHGRKRPTAANGQDSEVAPKKRGRRPGKHSDVNYTQTSLYLPRDLRNKVRARLYERGMEFSGLVEDMLRDWLAKQTDDSSR